MSIRVLVNGASGKMGQLAVSTILQEPSLTLVGQTGRTHNLAQEIKNANAQVVVDLTNADVVYKNVKTIIESGVHPVIGTSGLQSDQVKSLQAECQKQKLGGIIVPNFSLGAILMMKYAQEIAKYFPHLEIIEMHHDGKLDSPSGTAIRTAELIAATRNMPALSQQHTRETLPGARGASYQQIPIHAIRLPGLMAHQQIIFGGTGETLTLTHNSIDRKSFMPGILLACQKVVALDHLQYGLEQLL